MENFDYEMLTVGDIWDASRALTKESGIKVQPSELVDWCEGIEDSNSIVDVAVRKILKDDYDKFVSEGLGTAELFKRLGLPKK